jgi:DMSO/TMAO reductase YedYZ heme-binding membrane subunit
MKISAEARLIVLVNSLIPLAMLGWDALEGELGANPVNYAIRTTGMLSLVFLLLSLCITPMFKITKASGLMPLRKTFGLLAFFHTLLHFVLFVQFDRVGNLSDAFEEISLRSYLTVGFFSLILMVPLAVTSTTRMIKRLGGKNWKRLHKLAYVSAIAGVLHFTMLVKADLTRPLIAIGILSFLFAYRLLASNPQIARKPTLVKSSGSTKS